MPCFCLIYILPIWLMTTKTTKEKMKINDAINELHTACEYYDMVHDTGNDEQTKKNKDKVWKGYDIIVTALRKEISNNA